MEVGGILCSGPLGGGEGGTCAGAGTAQATAVPRSDARPEMGREVRSRFSAGGGTSGISILLHLVRSVSHIPSTQIPMVYLWLNARMLKCWLQEDLLGGSYLRDLAVTRAGEPPSLFLEPFLPSTRLCVFPSLDCQRPSSLCASAFPACA